MKHILPEHYYRISIKALITSRENKFLLCKENNGFWDLSGGGMDINEDVQSCLRREVFEEMGLEITTIDHQPSYFVVGKDFFGNPRAIVIYKVQVSNLNYIPSEECLEIRFCSAKEAQHLKLFSTIEKFTELFEQK